MDSALDPISSAEAARAFLEVKNVRDLSALKMQKLIYIAQEDHIVSQTRENRAWIHWTENPPMPLRNK